jgi:hypothetical protein
MDVGTEVKPDAWLVATELERHELAALARAAGVIAVTEVDDVCQIVDSIVVRTTVLGLLVPMGRVLYTGPVAGGREWLLARLAGEA